MYLTQQYYPVTPNMTVDYQGLATAVYPGHDTITIFGYTSCGDFRKSTKEVTILGPGPIQIADSILCTGTATQAFDIVPDGRWRLAGSAVAMVDSITGNMVCVQPGIDTLTYRISSNNCSTKKIISVSPLPLPVTGDSLQVQGGKLTLHSTGGYWRFDTTQLAMDTTFGGYDKPVFTALGSGRIPIYYVAPTGCFCSFSLRILDVAGEPYLYPNPVHDELFIMDNSGHYRSCLAYDMAGKQMPVPIPAVGLSSWNVSALPKGVYNLVFIRNDGIQKQRRIVKY